MRESARLVVVAQWLCLFCFCNPEKTNAQSTDSWSVPVHMQIGTASFNLRFGIHPDATTGYDADTDSLSPPPAFTPYAVFMIPVFPNTLRADFRGPDSLITWNLAILNASGQSIRIDWNTSQFPTSGVLALNDSLDMLAQSSADFVGDQILTIKYAAIPATNTTTPVNTTPESFTIKNYPNPFGTTTTLEVNTPASTPVTIHIFSVLGQEVRTFVLARMQPGTRRIVWDGKDAKGRSVPAGIYFCRLEAAGHFVEKKLYRLR